MSSASALVGQLTDNTSQSTAVPPAGQQTYPVSRWVTAWAVILVVLFLLTRFRAGYVAVYYALALALLLLVVVNYGWFQSALAPLQSLQSGFAPSSGS